MRKRQVSLFFVVVFCLASGALLGGCKDMRCEISYKGCQLECGDDVLCKAGCEIQRGLCKL